MSTDSQKVIKKQVEEVRSSEGPFQITPNASDEEPITRCFGYIEGPRQTGFAGGRFAFKLRFPEGYPDEQPQFRFSTQIYHPNIDENDGTVGLEVLQHALWNSKTTILNLLERVHELLKEPDLDSYVLNEDAASLAREGGSAFKERAQRYTKDYARR
jgi:ubiquitin-conjugating enzyme E2 H